MNQDELISLVSKVCKELDGVSIEEAFCKHDGYLSGKIGFRLLDVELSFVVQIMDCYPLTVPNADNNSIRFSNKDLIGYPHVNSDGSVCVHPAKDHDADRKMKQEFLKLKDWIKRFHVRKETEDRYEYVVNPVDNGNFNPLFFTNLSKKLKKGNHGKFTFGWLDQNINLKETNKLYRLSLNDENDKWSSSFHAKFKGHQKRSGYWYFTDAEPLKLDFGDKRLGAQNWNELHNYLDASFVKEILSDLRNNKIKITLQFNGKVSILLGYNIPNDDGYEVNWDLVWLDLNDFPYEKKYAGKEKYTIIAKTTRVQWGKTVNSDYERFFGRGKLNDKLANGRVLVIGCGAIGSSVSETLVRGGVRDILIEDFDFVEQGNLCRANYQLSDVFKSKVDALKNRLESISPFVNIHPYHYKINGSKLSSLKEGLNNSFEVIIDSSADPEVSYIIDQIDFKGHFFSLSITNHAKNLLCVSGKEASIKTHLLYLNRENEPATYLEGAGCGYPTFQASYNDINALVNVSIKLINRSVAGAPQNYSVVLSDELEGVLITDYLELRSSSTNQILLVEKKLLKIIESHLEERYPKEFGGIFVGSKSETAALISEVLIPDSYKNGRSIFVREPKNLNERLKLIFEESNGRLVYLGEWHSHPDAAPLPSSTDKKAMIAIAQDEMVKNEKPILMITGLTKESALHKFYLQNENLESYE